ncbi:MAG: catechol 1,2-dioxygenase [Acetobacteraceae bacterium]|nr:catechol 1,2-dioxygenase [Acetobacteraceae bacterium]
MAESLLNTKQVKDLLNKVAGLDQPGGNERLKRIVHRVSQDICQVIEEFDVTPTEFWTAVSYITRLGQAHEVGLLVPGLGIEHFLDLRMDEKERQAGLKGGTPRTIEGPLYITDAPLSKGEARLDQDPEQGEVLFMEGQVKNADGKPVAGAIVDVWHANTKGGYSHFDPSQSAYNLRRRIETDAEGRYRFRSILPSGYGCPPNGPTQELLTAIGRHGRRPAHIHFFVEAPGFRKLTTQINIADDEYLHDDFAFATRDGLIPEIVRHTDAAEIKARGLNEPFATIRFDFTLTRDAANLPEAVVVREHAQAA